jgi:hypothetical protein
MTNDIEVQRAKLVAAMTGMLLRLGRSRSFLTLEQRFTVAETLRDVADELEQGRVLRPAPAR